MTLNVLILVTVPCGVTTLIGPEMALGGTTALMVRSWKLARALVKVALAPLNSTPAAPVKFVPVRVTLVPGKPLTAEISEPVNPGAGVGYQRSRKSPHIESVRLPGYFAATL